MPIANRRSPAHRSMASLDVATIETRRTRARCTGASGTWPGLHKAAAITKQPSFYQFMTVMHELSTIGAVTVMHELSTIGAVTLPMCGAWQLGCASEGGAACGCHVAGIHGACMHPCRYLIDNYIARPWSMQDVERADLFYKCEERSRCFAPSLHLLL